MNEEITNPPFCPRCLGRSLRKSGINKGRQYYQCKACGRQSFGGVPGPPPRPPQFPCPHCKGRCQKAGRANGGGPQRYWCTACRKYNTELFPQTPRSPGGPFRHRVALYLGPAALEGLRSSCSRLGASPAQAARAIFREAGREPVVVIGVGRRVHSPQTATLGLSLAGRRLHDNPAPLAPLFAGPQRFPDVRRAVLQKRMRRSGGEKYLPTVYVVARLSLTLDDLAWQGLTRTMRKLGGVTHQEAARILLAQARAD